MAALYATLLALTPALLSSETCQSIPCIVKSHEKIGDAGLGGALDAGDGFSCVGLLGKLNDDDDGGTDTGAAYVLFLTEDGTVASYQKISDPDLGGGLDPGDRFGVIAAGIEDQGTGGNAFLAVGAPLDDDGGTDRGAAWIIFLGPDGAVQSYDKINDTDLGGGLGPGSYFGQSLASLGDFNNDGHTDIAVGAPSVGDPLGAGAVWLLFLDSAGTVTSYEKIDSADLPPGALSPGDGFGNSVARLGDLDGDGVVELAIGAHRDDDGGLDRGAVWVLSVHPDGTVKSYQKISDTEGGFRGSLDDSDFFGVSLASPGDLDGDGVNDLVAGAHFDNDGGPDRGAVWLLFLNADATVRSCQKISATDGGFPGPLDDSDLFGVRIAGIADLDGDGLPVLAVGAYLDDDGGLDVGAVWILFLDNGCPWDCAGDCDGNVGIADFLALLGEWGGPGGCDLNGGGVGITDFLELLQQWGACPP